MRQPLAGRGLPPKQPALSLTKCMSPSLHTNPLSTRSPEVVMEPVRMKTPASAAVGPTVGANCRGGVTADAIGMAKCGAERTLEVSGEGLHAEKRARTNIKQRIHKNTHAIYPGSGPS